MKKIIEEVLDAERQLDKILSEARSQASCIKNDADKKMTEKLNLAQEKARQIYRESIEQAEKEARQQAEEKISEAEMQKKKTLAGQTDNIDRLAEDICRLIKKTEYDMDA